MQIEGNMNLKAEISVKLLQQKKEVLSLNTIELKYQHLQMIFQTKRKVLFPL